MNKPLEVPARKLVPGEAGRARPHESAHLHVAGTAAYTDDLPELAGTLHAALGLSPLAHGVLRHIDVQALRALSGVVDVITAEDIPGRNDCGSLVRDDPILAGPAVAGPSATLRYAGQPVFMVLAARREDARRAAAKARDVIRADPLPPRLGALEAHAAGDYVVPPMHLVRGDASAAIAAAPLRLAERFELGGQEHFYLEGQVAYAVPTEDGGMRVHCSTQHPSEMQHLVAHALGRPAHAVQVECRRMGGGFGGKETQSALFACAAAVAAQRTGRPVKLRLDRDDDFLVTGFRHDFHAEVEIGHDAQGRVLGAQATLVARAGHSADLSGPVMTRALCHFDNAYFLPQVAVHGYSARTNTQSNTAFRGFGGPQGAFAIEYALDSVARRLGLDPLEVRKRNFYGIGERDLTPYGQRVEDNVLHELVAQLETRSDYASRREAIARFNRTSPVLKRGIALTPVKFGISFNVPHLNQAGALVHVYTDGSVLVNHGGTEMGQGLNTKVAQVVAHELGVPFDRVRVSATDTTKVANTSATAASTGSDLNGKAAQHAARQIRERLAAFAAQRHGGETDAVRFEDGHVLIGGRPAKDAEAPQGGDQVLHSQRAGQEGGGHDGGRHDQGGHDGGQVLPFASLVQQAYEARVQLWSDGFYATPGLSWDRKTLQGKPFYYFAYGAAVSEVIVDTLTGEHRVLRADLLHDAGRSLNPAIDLGQVEGGFIQGMGWLTMEELVWHPQTGRLATHAPSTYKIPTANDLPGVFRVALFDRDNPQDTVHRSKAVGEPPLLLAFSVFFALRDAVAAAGPERCAPPLRAPATPEAVLAAIEAVRRGA